MWMENEIWIYFILMSSELCSLHKTPSAQWHRHNDREVVILHWVVPVASQLILRALYSLQDITSFSSSLQTLSPGVPHAFKLCSIFIFWWTKVFNFYIVKYINIFWGDFFMLWESISILGHQYFLQFLYPFMVSPLIFICFVVRNRENLTRLPSLLPSTPPNKLTNYPISFVEQTILSSRICDLW